MIKSEAHEKRLLLKMALQNLELKGKKARYDWIKPFDRIAFYASRQSWLAQWDSFRRANWTDMFADPETTLAQTQQLLTITN